MSISPPPSVLSEPSRSSKFSAFCRLIRLSSQTGTLLLLIPSLWALILASHGRPDPTLVVVFVLGAFFMRSAGVVFNDIADRNIDRHVRRTRHRPLACGALSVAEAVSFAGVLIVCCAGLLTFLNPLTVMLSPIALLLAAVYPLAKRVIHLPQGILGIAFGWGAVMAWTAVRNQLEWPTWLIFGGTICWAIAYDTIYAMQDREDDRRVGVKSSALLFGRNVWAAVAVFSSLTLGCIAMAGWVTDSHASLYLMLSGACVFLAWQVSVLAEDHPPETYFKLFRQHAGVGLWILAAIWMGTV